MKLKTLSILLFAIAIISLLTTCKKYPENDLWFKSPESAFVGGKFTSFTVDGVDSMPMWDNIFSTPQINTHSTVTKGTDIILHQESPGQLRSQLGSGSWHYFDNKKYLYIFFKMYSDYAPAPTYNLFYTNEGNWKVLKLTKSGDLKIQRTYNGKVYEMEFN